MKELRNDWALAEVEALFALPFNDLLFQAHTLHRKNFNPNQVQVSSLLNIKTGACPEDCSYCSQSSKYDTGLEREKLMEVDAVLKQAQEAKDKGATRFCMGAAWRNPTDKSLDKVIPMIQGVKAMGLETCVTLGMLTQEQAFTLKEAGLDYYNHNIDTSKENYSNVITTRSFQDRLNTLESVQNADIHVCSGGILGLGEGQTDRASMLRSLANLEKHPDSVPLNLLVPIPGTPFEAIEPPTESEFVRTIAVARLMMPKSVVRLSAGRTEMGEALQALCFFAGANSIFYGDQLLTTDNPDTNTDQILFERLGINQQLLNSH
ncbi:Biotin synthase (EC [Bathymodiolus thermophilus thioautotrophic gill symbiont]|jgi:biotin synthase|uniref:Biotin synthase n=3 Tax=sulfur-oxidizing symbionts TaxID=32036 RepID=A0A1H6KU05_9GAMM|nr:MULTISPECIES: biotin synthase BioB [sulfur-oxidizing symbionts]CAC9522659.1 Biotin synthase (EC 2.8.1.6) [uncultured Gammaproteobacteria bacterium]CAB5504594.1 Biotin synthase (EC [Bathymodiolus thermophilus thioautotrophic gill symbiont]CAB5507290.1 Biotin synthase (EC [Bathymodiolus azoricus thioautotrophic gill symbiont]CAC9527651.1 Biotin synthase (EC 2.8.1.6) [uncultured Gammaproteobacteria bacterium]CAC9982550.1 Biotin synthase (EC 2.8.1.6) [uncultured Gammaproteobacteria bacterium]